MVQPIRRNPGLRSPEKERAVSEVTGDSPLGVPAGVLAVGKAHGKAAA